MSQLKLDLIDFLNPAFRRLLVTVQTHGNK